MDQGVVSKPVDSELGNDIHTPHPEYINTGTSNPSNFTNTPSISNGSGPLNPNSKPANTNEILPGKTKPGTEVHVGTGTGVAPGDEYYVPSSRPVKPSTETPIHEAPSYGNGLGTSPSDEPSKSIYKPVKPAQESPTYERPHQQEAPKYEAPKYESKPGRNESPAPHFDAPKSSPSPSPSRSSDKPSSSPRRR
jgi:hypothetical protein